VLQKSVALFNTLFPNLQWTISQRWFDFISTVDSGTAMLFMNYGYADLDPQAQPLLLAPADDDHRYSIQLYHHVAGAIDLTGLDVIEIGCGRGGGADYIQRYLKSNGTTGIDLSAKAIDFCNQHYNVAGLSFQRGNAEELAFPDASFDAVVNIESSICYQYIDKFFSEVVRILKPGGYFLYADLRNREEIGAWEAHLAQINLEKLSQKNITPNVLLALDLDNDRKQLLIKRYAPRILHKPFNEFAGVKGSRFFYGAFQNGEKEYRSYLFRKPV
jgi:ubiquinone/menaquinone biosynthesis C-methylase UbiE